MSERNFVNVLASFENGRIRPLQLENKEGQKYQIDKITDIRRAASPSGGSGIRYSCLISGRCLLLFFDEWENLWWCDRCD